MTPIQLNLKQSKLGSILLILVSAMALSILIVLVLSWQLRIILTITIVVSTVYTLYCHTLRLLPWSIVSIKINSKGEMQWLRKDGKSLEIHLQANSTVTPYLTVLNGRLVGASFKNKIFNQRIVILSDAVDADIYRKLRVYLIWAKLEESTRPNNQRN